MMKVSIYIAASVDGFIAEKDGGIEWLHAAQYQISGEDFGYADFMRDVDCLVMGRNTFEKVLEFGSWPFAGKRVVVLSRTLAQLPATVAAELTAEAPEDLVRRLRGEGVKKIYLDGGKTIQSFLRARLVTDMTMTSIPLLLSGGLPLFADLQAKIGLRLLRSQGYPNGFVQNCWQLE